MYSTCLFCNSTLGRNELIEPFPVGRRLAFDSTKGRLWVICPSCRRWNLSPLDARWEAIDECERRFRGTRLHASTEHIGLAEFPHGFALIRVGRPLRPELAAWRYGRQFGWRRLRTSIAVGVGLTGAAAVGVAGLGAGLGIYALYAAWGIGALAVNGVPMRVVARVPVEGRLLRVRREDLSRLRVFPDESRGGFGLVLHHSSGVELLGGAPARYAMGKLFPAINRFGTDRETLGDATELLEQRGDAAEYMHWMLERASMRVQDSLTNFPEADSLALEIALHEEMERRALEGELAELEQAWREAEEVAAIADNLLVPASVHRHLQALRQRLGSDSGVGS